MAGNRMAPVKEVMQQRLLPVRYSILSVVHFGHTAAPNDILPNGDLRATIRTRSNLCAGYIPYVCGWTDRHWA